jgi:undecaprenyl pyrophosphate phosphatase UppP
LIETIPAVKQLKTERPDDYASIKLIVSSTIAIVIGLLITNWLDVAFFSQLNIQGLNHDVDKLLSGAIAGAIAPYTHQLIEILLKTQRLLDSKKNEIEQVRVQLESKTDTPES